MGFTVFVSNTEGFRSDILTILTENAYFSYEQVVKPWGEYPERICMAFTAQ